MSLSHSRPLSGSDSGLIILWLCHSSLSLNMLMGTLLTFVLVSVTPKVLGLSLTQVHVPPFGLGGQSVELGCEYDTQGEQVYSVKWYKGGLEIFRFIPSNNPPMAVFSRTGVSINTDLSNATLLHLSNLTVASTGRYRCEVSKTLKQFEQARNFIFQVSTEAPMFSTESKYGDLLVIVLPAHPPKVTLFSLFIFRNFIVTDIW